MCRGSAGCAGAGAASICPPEGLNLLKQGILLEMGILKTCQELTNVLSMLTPLLTPVPSFTVLGLSWLKARESGYHRVSHSLAIAPPAPHEGQGWCGATSILVGAMRC